MTKSSFARQAALPAAPSETLPAKAEYEVTDNLAHSGCHDQDVKNLLRLLNHPTLIAASSRDYVSHLKNKSFYRECEYGHALLTEPQTWYLNTARQKLRGTNNLRVRFTPYMTDFFQLAVKGNAEDFNGPGGLLRHEDEITTRTIQLNPAAFTDPMSQRILEPLMGRKLFFYHLSSVKRYLIGIEGEVNGKRGMSEIAFDAIEYRFHGNKADEPLVTFHRLCQNEREYMNPHSEVHEDFCRDMGYEMLNKKEIEMLLHQTSQMVRGAAQEIGVTLEPCPRSKGQIGFDELARYQGIKVAQPPNKRFPVFF